MMGFRKFDNGWRFRFGPVLFRHFRGWGSRLVISLHHDFAIRLFGFNQRSFHFFWKEDES